MIVLLLMFLLDYSLVPTPPNLTPGMGNEKKTQQQPQKPAYHPHPLPPRPHPQQPAAATEPKRNDLEVVKQTYIFGFPLVVMDAAERIAALKANSFSNGRAWIDLQNGPIVLTFGQGSFNLQLIDGWTRTLKTFDDSFAGKSVVITQAGGVLNNTETLQIPTRMGLLIGTGGENITIRPYEANQSAVDLVSRMDGIAFFNKLMSLTQLDKDLRLNTIPGNVINSGAQQAFAQIQEAHDKGSAPAEDNDLSRAVHAYDLFK